MHSPECDGASARCHWCAGWCEMLTCGASVNYHPADASASIPPSLNHCLRKSSDSEVALLTWHTFCLKLLWQGTCKSLRCHGGKRPTFINLEACLTPFADGTGHNRHERVLFVFVCPRKSVIFLSELLLFGSWPQTPTDRPQDGKKKKKGDGHRSAELWMMKSTLCDASVSQPGNQSIN